MKKILFMSCFFCLSLGAMADDTQKIDGSKLASITFSGDNVVLHYNDGTTEEADMASITIDLSTTTGIEEKLTATEKAGVEGKRVYNLNGQLVGNSAARLAKGIYIIDGKKVIIK